MSTRLQIENIFLDALEQPAPDRARYVVLACGRDAELRRRVDRLLKAHSLAADFLVQPAVVRHDFDRSDFLGSLLGTSSTGTTDRKTRDALAFLQPSLRSDSLGRLAHYEVLEVLSVSSFGTVVKAFDEKLHRLVAIKLMAPLLATNSAARRRFSREARSGAAIRQENVVAIYAVEEKPLPYLVMEYIAGQTLQQKLDQTGALDVSMVLHIGHQIARGLAAAHARGLIHRDIKPGNILLDKSLLDENERVTITDFGLARAADDASLSHLGYIAGTPMYMAPEQALGEAIDQRADMFSLGSVLYVMCCGQPAFRAADTLGTLKRVVEDVPRPIREINPAVPDWLCDLIEHLHAKKPADRYGSARDLANLLAYRLQSLQTAEVRAIAEGAVAEVTPASNHPPQPTPAIRTLRFGHRYRFVAAAALLMFAGETTGVTNVRGTVLRLFAAEGTLVVEIDDPDISVMVDGSDLIISGLGAKEIRLKPGRYQVEASKDGKVVSRELVSITNNHRQVLRVSQVRAD